MASEAAADEFLTYFVSLNETDKKVFIQEIKTMGGKFALLARILEGDKEAESELRAHIDSGRVAPNRDLTVSIN